MSAEPLMIIIVGDPRKQQSEGEQDQPPEKLELDALTSNLAKDEDTSELGQWENAGGQNLCWSRGRRDNPGSDRVSLHSGPRGNVKLFRHE